MCAQLGLYHYHPHDSRRSESGWLDSTIIHKRTGNIIFAELKSDTGQLTGEQRAVTYMHHAAGRTALLWRPADLHTIGPALADFKRTGHWR